MMEPVRHLVGTMIRCEVAINQDGRLVDVETATVTIDLPTGEKIETVAAHLERGRYGYRYKLRDVGMHTFTVETTNPDTIRQGQVYALPGAQVALRSGND